MIFILDYQWIKLGNAFLTSIRLVIIYDELHVIYYQARNSLCHACHGFKNLFTVEPLQKVFDSLRVSGIVLKCILIVLEVWLLFHLKWWNVLRNLWRLPLSCSCCGCNKLQSNFFHNPSPFVNSTHSHRNSFPRHWIWGCRQARTQVLYPHT